MSPTAAAESLVKPAITQPQEKSMVNPREQTKAAGQRRGCLGNEGGCWQIQLIIGHICRLDWASTSET